MDDTVMSKHSVEKVLSALRDGRWHKLEEVMDETKIDEQETRLVMSFLREFRFIRIDEKANKAKLDASTKQFLEKTDVEPSYEEITA